MILIVDGYIVCVVKRRSTNIYELSVEDSNYLRDKYKDSKPHKVYHIASPDFKCTTFLMDLNTFSFNQHNTGNILFMDAKIEHELTLNIAISVYRAAKIQKYLDN